MKQIDEAAFKEDANGGMPFRELMKKYGTSPSRTKKLMGSGEPETVLEDDAPEAFDITINVPADRVMDCIRGTSQDQLLEAIDALDAQAQANIFQSVMQKKFDRLLAPTNRLEFTPISIGEGESH